MGRWGGGGGGGGGGWQEGAMCRESRSLVVKDYNFQAVVNVLFIWISPNVTF